MKNAYSRTFCFCYWLSLVCAPGGYAATAAAQQCMTNGNGPVAAGSPLAAGRTTGSPTDGPPSMQTIGAGGGQQGAQNQQNGPNNPMAALMSVADNLPPGSPQSARGSPPGSTGPNAQAPVGPRSASRGSQHSPNSTGTYPSDTKRRSTAHTKRTEAPCVSEKNLLHLKSDRTHIAPPLFPIS